MWVLMLFLGGTAVSTDKVAWYPTEAACRSALNAFGPNGVSANAGFPYVALCIPVPSEKHIIGIGD